MYSYPFLGKTDTALLDAVSVFLLLFTPKLKASTKKAFQIRLICYMVPTERWGVFL